MGKLTFRGGIRCADLKIISNSKLPESDRLNFKTLKNAVSCFGAKIV
jgi:hypothetical protein